MTTFDEREQAFERKFAHDQKLRFDIEARACKLFGLWLAEKMGLSGDAVKNYALEVVQSNLTEEGFDDVFRKVANDLKKKNISISDHMLHTQFEAFLQEAEKQIQAQ